MNILFRMLMKSILDGMCFRFLAGLATFHLVLPVGIVKVRLFPFSVNKWKNTVEIIVWMSKELWVAIIYVQDIFHFNIDFVTHEGMCFVRTFVHLFRC